jgi:hypothetical protein
MQLDGVNFGTLPAAVSVTLAADDGSAAQDCPPCFLDHRVARCVTSASRTRAYNVTVTVAGLRSGPAVYDYRDIIKAPAFLSVSPLLIPTAGDTLLTITGTQRPRTRVSATKYGGAVVVCVLGEVRGGGLGAGAGGMCLVFHFRPPHAATRGCVRDGHFLAVTAARVATCPTAHVVCAARGICRV